MQQLLYADEVRSLTEVPLPDGEVREAELKLAKQLVDQIASETFEPDAVRGRGREADPGRHRAQGAGPGDLGERAERPSAGPHHRPDGGAKASLGKGAGAPRPRPSTAPRPPKNRTKLKHTILDVALAGQRMPLRPSPSARRSGNGTRQRQASPWRRFVRAKNRALYIVAALSGYTTQDVARMIGVSSGRLRAYLRAGVLSPRRASAASCASRFKICCCCARPRGS